MLVTVLLYFCHLQGLKEIAELHAEHILSLIKHNIIWNVLASESISV